MIIIFKEVVRLMGQPGLALPHIHSYISPLGDSKSRFCLALVSIVQILLWCDNN